MIPAGTDPSLTFPSFESTIGTMCGRLNCEVMVSWHPETPGPSLPLVADEVAKSRRVVDARVEDSVRAVPAGLGYVHRDVCLAEEVVDGVIVVRVGDTDAGRRAHLHSLRCLELAGALFEVREDILRKDFPQLRWSTISSLASGRDWWCRCAFRLVEHETHRTHATFTRDSYLGPSACAYRHYTLEETSPLIAVRRSLAVHGVLIGFSQRIRSFTEHRCPA